MSVVIALTFSTKKTFSTYFNQFFCLPEWVWLH
jgi:hypothetical protein